MNKLITETKNFPDDGIAMRGSGYGA